MARKGKARGPARKAAGTRGRILRRPVWRFALFYAAGFLAAAILVFAQRAGGWTLPWHGGGASRDPAAISGKAAADRVPQYRRGVELLASELFSEALKELTAAARLAPDDPRPHYKLGRAYQGLQLTDLEELAYRAALRLDPAYHPAKLSLARALCDFGRNEEALRLLEEARKARPDDPLVWAEMALNHLRLGRAEKAVELLNQYNAAAGKQDWGYANLGRAHADLGNHDAAEKAYRQAIAIHPHAELARLWLGQLLITRGKKAEADRVLEEFRRLRHLQTEAFQIKATLLRDPNNLRALLALAEIRNLLGRPGEALISLNRALDLDPKNVQALISVAHALTLLGRPKEALAPLKEALAIEPDNQKLRELYEKRRRAVEGLRGSE